MIISDVNWTGRPSKDKEQDSWNCAIWQTHVHANSCLKLLTWILAVHSHSKTMYDTHAHAHGQFPMRKVRLGEIKHLPQSYTPTTWEKNFINCCENQQDYGEVLGIGEQGFTRIGFKCCVCFSPNRCFWANPFLALSLRFFSCKMRRQDHMGQFRGRVAAHGELVFGKTEAGSRLV